MRFNPAPGWPPPPNVNWMPPKGWLPAADWPPAPPGWQFVIPADAPETGPATQLAKGANAPVDANIRVTTTPGLDVSALVLTGDKVSSDNDMIFFNQPTQPGVSWDPLGISVDLRQLRAGATRVVVIASPSDDSLTFGSLQAVSVKVASNGSATTFDIPGLSSERAVILCELYERNGGYRVRAVGQGYASGLAGVATDFGISVEDEPPPATSVRELSPHQPPALPASQPVPRPVAEGLCPRCGSPRKKKRLGGGYQPCKTCENRLQQFLNGWRAQAQVAVEAGAASPQYAKLWVDLAAEQVSEATGQEIVRPLIFSRLQRQVAFAFADDLIERSELDDYLSEVASFDVGGLPQVQAMTQRMQNGFALAAIKNGDLPVVTNHGLHLETAELVHLDVPTTRIRFLASGPKHTPGRLLVTNRKLRFIGATGGGAEIAWVKVLGTDVQAGGINITVSSGQIGGVYTLPEPRYADAVITGALRVAKRLVLAPGQRDSRAVPQWMRTEVWQRDQAKCAECGATEYLEFDHVIPHSLGGATSVNNLQLLCRRCNLEKGARL